MMGRAVLLLTMAGAMLLACAGVVLAQQTGPDRTAPGSNGQERAGEVRPDRYIVVLEDDVADPAAVANEHAQRHGLPEVSHVYRNAIKGYAANIPAQALNRVRADERVQFISEDRVERAYAQTMPTGVNRVEADLSPTAAMAPREGPDPDVDVAVIDSGIAMHADLNVKGGHNCTGGKTTNYKDGHGHGTHVAGTAGARDDTAGVVGVAPGARLWAVKVLGNAGWGYTSWVICGIDWVTAKNKDANLGNDIEVANMSLGATIGDGADDGDCGRTNNDAKHLAICKSVNEDPKKPDTVRDFGDYPGVTYAVAAGNDGVDASRDTPASYDEVITVSNLADYDGSSGGRGSAPPSGCSLSQPDNDDTFRRTSNFGTDVDLGAPGTCIYSTVPGGGYGFMTGTSMASPHVAGAVALYKATHPSAAPSEVRAAMVSSANSEAAGAGHTDPSGKHPEPVMLANNY